jgi:secreted trypsin-like serine protease
MHTVDLGGCGASLIYEDIVLSAAHCNSGNDIAIIGAYNRNSEDEEGERRSIVERRQHPEYNSGTLEYDFLVLKLDQNVR